MRVCESACDERGERRVFPTEWGVQLYFRAGQGDWKGDRKERTAGGMDEAGGGAGEYDTREDRRDGE